jgi:hypothetical protein
MQGSHEATVLSHTPVVWGVWGEDRTPYDCQTDQTDELMTDDRPMTMTTMTPMTDETDR